MPVKNGYAKRNAQAAENIAEMDMDSDPEFQSGAYVATPAPKRKAPNVMEKAASKKQKTRKHVSTVNRTTYTNPLLEYFGNLDLESASEDEDDEEPFGDEPSVSDSAPANSTMETARVQTPSPEIPGTSSKPIVLEEADTEPESEAEVDKSKSSVPCDDDTEPESDSDQNIPFVFPPPPVLYAKDDSDSEKEGVSPCPVVGIKASATPPKFSPVDDEADTEPETDEEVTSRIPDNEVPDTESEDFDPVLTTAIQKQFNARPGFPLKEKQAILDAFVLDKEQGIEVPSAINTYLRDYQRDGVQFLWKQYKEGRGGVLGDDMGKTIQIISFLSAIMKKNGDERDAERRHKHVSDLQDGEEWHTKRKLPPANATWPTCLIIAPSSVVHNWAREFETWGYFEVGLYNGNPKDREAVRKDFKMGRLDVVIATLELARKDIELLDDLAWSCVIIDEVHRVKNDTSMSGKAFHQFQCLRRFGLTGTTIQNSYKEMWSLIHWTNPGAVGTSKQWNGYVAKPLTLGQSSRATEDQRSKAMLVAQILKYKLLPNFFLRRTKDIIKDQLPKKMDQVVFCPLTKVQIAAYKRILGTDSVTNLLRSREQCECGSRKQRKNCCHPPVAGDVFRFMSALIKLSNHLALILPGPNDNPEQTARNRELAEIAFPDQPIPKYGPALLQAKYCGKWATLEVLLSEWHRNQTNKVLIFTKSVKLLEMLEFHLNNKSYSFLKLDGSTKQSDRMPMIDKFNNDKDIFIFLISTVAGGVGLNLTGANKVVIFDPNWNPAHDLQAMDRAFRFGQTRDVDVFRLLGAGSIEELIYARQIYKQQQMAIGYDASVQTRYFEGVQGDNHHKGELFGIENIFKLHESDELATKMAIEKAAIAELDWALAHMPGKKGSGNDFTSEILGASKKLGKDEGGLGALASLLFDDDATPAAKKLQQDPIQQTLKNIGVKYSHVNDELLLPSLIEAERAKMTLKKKREKGKSKRASTSKAPKGKKEPAREIPPWPPRRPKVNKELTPHQKAINTLQARRKALLALGLIQSPQDLPNYALKFIQSQTLEQQQDYLKMLDDFAAKQSDDDDDSSD